MILETKRLYLKELTTNDFPALCAILQDIRVMYAYEHAFSKEECKEWFERQLSRYKKDGFGLWAVILKETNQLIGQCGITIQEIPHKKVLEIGYLFNYDYWHQGFAIEAASACKQYAFTSLQAKEVYSIIRDINVASKHVAIKNGMQKVTQFTKHYQGINMPHDVYLVKNNS